jgi:Mrp family chromosome partitioning ATPase
MLVGDRWRLLKREMESQFDFVVIDTSPLLLVTDTILLAREADGVILSVLLGVSQIARIAESVNRLQAVGAEVVGVVVNNVKCDVQHHKLAYRSKYPASPVQAVPLEMAHRSSGSETNGHAGVSELSGVSTDGVLPFAEECCEEV